MSWIFQTKRTRNYLYTTLCAQWQHGINRDYFCHDIITAYTKHWSNVCSMLAHRLRRWPNFKRTSIHQTLIQCNFFSMLFHRLWRWANIKPALIQCLVSTAMCWERMKCHRYVWTKLMRSHQTHRPTVHSKHDTLNQCRFNVGPTSKTAV